LLVLVLLLLLLLVLAFAGRWPLVARVRLPERTEKHK
jgi:putative copper export protein